MAKRHEVQFLVTVKVKHDIASRQVAKEIKTRVNEVCCHSVEDGVGVGSPRNIQISKIETAPDLSRMEY
jgi:hypothetical protein